MTTEPTESTDVLIISTKSVEYHGETWYIATIEQGRLAHTEAYGRTAVRAAGFAFQKFADKLLAVTKKDVTT